MAFDPSLNDRGLSRRGLLRLGGVTAGATAVAPLLSACGRTPDAGSGSGSGAGDSGGTFTLYFNVGHVYDTYAGIIKKFEQDHNLTVNLQKFQWPDLETRLQADFAAGTVPDLSEHSGGDSVVALAATDDILDLGKYVSQDGKKVGFPDDWQDQAAKTWMLGGKTYGVQLQLTCHQLYYNKDMLDKAGITTAPSTWGDFLTAAKQLTNGDVYGFAVNQDYSYSWPFMLQNGVSFYDAASRDFLTPHDAAIETLQFLQDLVHKHKVSPVPVPSNDPGGPRSLLTAGRTAMIVTGPWDIAPIHKGAPSLKLGLADPLTKAQKKTSFAGAGLFIPKKAKRPDLAWDLIKRLTTLDAEVALTKEASQTMPRKSWATSPQIAAMPEIAAVAKALPVGVDWGQPLAQTGKLAQVNLLYKTLYQSVVISAKSPASELDTFLSAAKKAVSA